MPTIRVHGRSIHFRDQGSGVPIVLVHSGGLSSRQWTRVTSRLVATHRVLAPDLLGSGESDPVPPDQPFDYAEDVAVLDALLATIEGPYHLAGHSYGGLVALTSARNRPERVLSLSVFEPVAFGVLYSANDVAAIRDLEREDDDGRFLDDAFGGTEPWMERFIDWWQGPGTWRSLPDPSRAAMLSVGRKVFQEVRSLTADRTPREAYAALDVPTLVMTASQSPLAARRVCAILAEAMRGKLVTIGDAGHMAPLTHAHVVGEHIAEHVRAVDRARS
jgi:pimeloyl-ACP methyl ester carboxylesterase